MPDYDIEWWREHGQDVKDRLDRAERLLDTDPDAAFTIGAEVLELMERRGFPDWWSRVTRLQADATFRSFRRGGAAFS